jgi:hypothetical protein
MARDQNHVCDFKAARITREGVLIVNMDRFKTRMRLNDKVFRSNLLFRSM